MVAPAPNWTGFYIFGGGGGGSGMLTSTTRTSVLAFRRHCIDQRVRVAMAGLARSASAMTGSSAVGWVAGIFGDGQFGSLKGTIRIEFRRPDRHDKMEDAWAGGARVGYLVAPNVLSYVNGGYSGSHWSGTT